MSSRLDRLANIAVIVTCTAVSAWVSMQLWQRSSANPRPNTGDSVENIEAANVIVSVKDSASVGRPDAGLVIVEFSDFQCAYCGRYARETYPQIVRDFVLNGKARYVFRNLPIQSHPLALNAAKAALCAREQDRYLEMREQLFAHQEALSLSDLLRHADTLRLDVPTFQACMNRAPTPQIESDLAEAKRVGIQGAPTFLVGIPLPDGQMRSLRKLRGAQPYEAFKSMLEGLVDKRTRGTSPEGSVARRARL